MVDDYFIDAASWNPAFRQFFFLSQIKYNWDTIWVQRNVPSPINITLDLAVTVFVCLFYCYD